jgi:hypothetical protein
VAFLAHGLHFTVLDSGSDFPVDAQPADLTGYLISSTTVERENDPSFLASPVWSVISDGTSLVLAYCSPGLSPCHFKCD